MKKKNISILFEDCNKELKANQNKPDFFSINTSCFLGRDRNISLKSEKGEM